MMIQLFNKRFGTKDVLFDDSDYELISKYKWYLVHEKGNLYVRAYFKDGEKYKCKRMHRLVMGVDGIDKPHIDHKNGNGLDNRKINLRKATIAENTRNVGINSRNTTGYKGVSFYTVGNHSGEYVVRIRCNGKKYFGGYFKTPIDAAIKYNELAKKYHGEFAYLNKIYGKI